MHDDQLAGGVQFDPMCPAVKNLKPDLVLIGLQPPLHRRCGQGQIVRRAPDRTGPGDGINDAEGGEVFHIARLYQRCVLGNA